MSGSGPSYFAPAADVWTVGAVARAMKAIIEGALGGAIWIRGEVTALKVYSSGHWYFTLRDADSQLSCAMWRTYAQRAGQPPADGTEVFVLAAPQFWEEKGQFRLTVWRILSTAGVGQAALEFERVRGLLAKDGLFDPSRKRPLPALPRRIAVVTSLDGAALRDILHVARRRWPLAEVLVVGTRVQGIEAEAELVRALTLVNRLEAELCIVGRGGGAREDLALFNLESVCRALAAVAVPTVSAVGHETDVTLADLVADVRAATPSAAAELALPDRAEVLARIDALGTRLGRGLHRLTLLAGARLDRTEDRLSGGIERVMERMRRRLERAGARLEALSPLAVLARGYGVALDATGRVLRRRAEFAPGTPFTLRVVDGDVPAHAD